MFKLLGSFVSAIVLTVWSLGSVQQGIKDVRTSLTQLKYAPIRDMRRTVALSPQKFYTQGPDSLTIPVTGWGDRVDPLALEADREAVSARLRNPIESTELSIANGDAVYKKMCVPCHGSDMAADGPVAAAFMPPPDLLGEATRGRTDGFIYAYIRHGGVVMPRYGQSVTAHEAWDLVNFIRHRQKTTSR
ncbi:MAG: cytochrome c [Candidatus Eisenbacteria bacterium]|uniref:Cytochrome c n=1 Tax=Eiseniibacteriota bacterium TaxID=2212470 RepID=A0A849SIJ6_UNCEI|nr:cytochrome c [Candidatus Eisenbacteria bacterium]